jgi:Grap2 and cyclin-D-interacting
MATSQARGKAEKDLLSLRTTKETVLTLTTQFQTAVEVPVPCADPTKAKEKGMINALSLAHDAATLIRAHSSKLSLLCINAPFTSTALTTILREVSSGPLPALASAVELCDATTYTLAMRSELQYRVSKTLQEFGALVKEIPLDGSVLTESQRAGTATGQGKVNSKGIMSTTGVLWQACDSVIDLSKQGLPSLMIKKAEQYRDTLKDALEELQEWGEEASDDEDVDDEGYETGLTNSHDGLGEDAADGPDAAQEAIDQMFNGQQHIPTHDHDSIRPRLELTLRRLKLILLLYRAIVKRRLKPLPMAPSLEVIQRLDVIVPQLGAVPNAIDELASAFYSLDPAAIDAQMLHCANTAIEASESLLLNWEDKKDEFSEWAGKFAERMRDNDLNATVPP